MTNKQFYSILAAIILTGCFIFGVLIHIHNNLSTKIDTVDRYVNALMEDGYKYHSYRGHDE